MKYIIFLLISCANIYSQHYVNPQQAVSCGIEMVEKQIKLNALFPYPEQCLGHAIMQNKKDIAKYLCSLPNIKTDYEMAFPFDATVLPGKVIFNTMPLLAGAVIYNKDENDLDIIKCLLKAGANSQQEFYVKRPIEQSSSENNNIVRYKDLPCTPEKLAAGLQKDIIVGSFYWNLMEKSGLFKSSRPPTAID